MNAVRMGILALAVVAAIIAAVLAQSLVPSETDMNIPQIVQTPMADVLVAAEDLNVGRRVLSGDLRWQSWPEASLASSYVTRRDQPDALELYMNTVVRRELLGGEPVTPSKIISLENAGFMSAVLDPGMRAVSLSISPESSAGGFILPNDRVDILLTESLSYPVPSGDGTSPSMFKSKTLFENIRVLAIDQEFRDEAGTQVLLGQTATLEFSALEAEEFQAAKARGSLSLALRSLADANPALASLRRNANKDRSERYNMRIFRYGVSSNQNVRKGAEQ